MSAHIRPPHSVIANIRLSISRCLSGRTGVRGRRTGVHLEWWSRLRCASHRVQRRIAAKDGEKMRLTTRSIQRIIEKYAKKCGLPIKVSPHTLRHSFATDLLISGADLRSVQEMLGHESIRTTQVYTHVTNRQLRESHNAFHSRK